MEIKLTLTLDEVNFVLGALRELPMKLVYDIHTKIKNQAQVQVAEQEKEAIKSTKEAVKSTKEAKY